MMSWARPTGLHNSVKAVRPSISSEMETLAVHTARMIPRILMSVRPSALSILRSSPNVL